MLGVVWPRDLPISDVELVSASHLSYILQKELFFRLLSEVAMSGETAVQLEFRCTSCWQGLRADTDRVGTEIECKWCKRMVVVPEATDARIQQAAAAPPVEPTDDISFEDKPLSRDEIAKLAAERALKKANLSKKMEGPSSFPFASRFVRLLAVLVDSLLFGIAGVLGFVTLMALMSTGILEVNERGSFEETPMIVQLQIIAVMAFFPLALAAINWNMTAVQGQTIGKMLFRIKIVDEMGHAPGFFRGVIMRSWVVAFLGGIIPFFGLADSLWIFFDPPRCIHDHIAGTYVVNKIG